ncbi:MAG TPA: plastocyanin/azurin family copper-binding protein [Gaiellaceae bacterium]|jgi:uncharacterized cupredoxin-like copper-binding protein|nr:plastocyanin/azurin family copper-binding protein [Gaiellaceae bacterium]
MSITKRRLFAVTAALAGFALLAALPAFAGSSSSASPKLVKTVTVSISSKKEFHFTLSSSKFARAVVTFKITNNGVLPHDLEVCNSNKGGTANSCAGKKTTLISGQGGTGRLVKTFVLKGKYEYLCTVPGHAAQGMKGIITVT